MFPPDGRVLDGASSNAEHAVEELDIKNLDEKLRTCTQHSHGLKNLYKNLANREAQLGGSRCNESWGLTASGSEVVKFMRQKDKMLLISCNKMRAWRVSVSAHV